TIFTNPGNDYSGGTFVTGGTLTLGSDAAVGIGPLTLNGGILSDDGNPHTVNNPLIIAGGSSTVTTTASDTFTGKVSGSGGWSKSGAGNLFFNNAEVFTGSASINGGTFELAGGGS